MGFDKTKALNAAEKSLAQGKIAAAIQEYRKIVEYDAQDFSALNTLGDLYSRTGKPADAIDCFARVAEHYREQGFSLKAIAMYKKISRLDPGVRGVALNLARLYEQQGLYVEARAQYHTIADAAARGGRVQESLEALRRIADLDPKNSDIRLRLAEGYAREAMKQEAAAAYVEAGGLLLARNRAQEALGAYELAQRLIPASHAALEGLVAASCQVGAAGEAATLLEKVLTGVPGDLELRVMLARTYIAAEDAPAAERATDALVRAEGSNYTLWFDVARLYLKRGAADDAVRVLAGATEAALSGKQDAVLLDALGQALAQEPAHVEALKLLVRVHGWRRDDDQMRGALERLSEAAQAGGDAEEERRALEHLVRLIPFDQSYHERLHALGGASPAPPEVPPADAFTQAPAAATLSFDAPPSGAPSFDANAFDASAYEPTVLEPPAHDAPAAGEFTFDRDPFAAPDLAAEPAAAGDAFSPGVAEFEWNAVATAEPPREAQVQRVDPSASFADLGAAFADEPAPQSASSAFDFAFEPTAIEPPREWEAADPAAAAPENGHARADAVLRQELESVDFYLSQGYTDIAVDTLDMLERQFGQSPEIDARRERLLAAAPTAEPAADFGESHAAEQFPTPTADSLDSSYAFETHSLPSAPEAAEEFRIDETAFAGFARETEAATTPTPAAADPKLADIFGEFLDAEQQPVESRDEDFETHFNLGLAYKEMSLWDEAVEQFQKAIEIASPGDGTSRYLQCCNMLGHSLNEKGLPRAAAIWFKKAVSLPGISEDESQALRYDLASAYEAMGDIDRAIDTLTDVYAVDAAYRGVAEKLRELQSRRVGVSEG